MPVMIDNTPNKAFTQNLQSPNFIKENENLNFNNIPRVIDKSGNKNTNNFPDNSPGESALPNNTNLAPTKTGRVLEDYSDPRLLRENYTDNFNEKGKWIFQIDESGKQVPVWQPANSPLQIDESGNIPANGSPIQTLINNQKNYSSGNDGMIPDWQPEIKTNKFNPLLNQLWDKNR